MTYPPVNALCYGDCLDWMQRWDDSTVDLIYLEDYIRLMDHKGCAVCFDCGSSHGPAIAPG